jgi:diguanylate cyclase (GGDEF)-like protein/PAS domain S-box-containing protein
MVCTRTHQRLWPALALPIAVTALGIFLSSMDWPAPGRGADVAALMCAAIVTSWPAFQPVHRDWPALRLSFVGEFTSLLLFGAHPATLVAACGVLTRQLSDPQRSPRPSLLLLDSATVVVALHAAGWTHRTLGGGVNPLAWPWHVGPIAAAVLAYCVVTSASTDIVRPLFDNCLPEGSLRSWPRRLLEGCPVYFVAASIAVAVAEIVARRDWTVAAVVAAPLCLAYHVYRTHVNGLQQEHRRAEAIESLPDGVCILNAEGDVTLWNGALERLLECPRDRAIGYPVHVAVPALGDTRLPRVIQHVAATRVPRTVPQVGVRCTEGLRLLQVTLTPVTAGVVLLWQNVTEHNKALRTLQRYRERVGLAAEAANDGHWEWDLSTHAFSVTPRWKTMIGLPATAVISGPEAWLDRVHPDDIGSLNEALGAHLAGNTEALQHEHRIRHEDGSYRSFECRGVATAQTQGRATRLAGSLTDTTDLAMTQERLRHAVFLDPLTGLCNRVVLVEHLRLRLADFKGRQGNDLFALLYLDLDRFKVVNDSLGHLVGDELLIAVSRRLESCLREGDVLARLGGDEFAILLNGLQVEEQANVIACRVHDTLSRPFSIGGREVFTSASIGIAFGLARYTSPDQIMHHADTAMYQAKARGKARHEVFDADMDARARDRLGIENDLRRAVNSSNFETHYQPVVSLASGMCVGFEALLRWRRNGRPVPPQTFIPIAEDLGLIEALGTRVLEDACRIFAEWQRRYPEAALEFIAVNVSFRQLMQPDFLSVVNGAVRQARLKPSALRIEITETALMTNPDVAAKAVSRLRDSGIKIYLDDFGTGYSSLSHLHTLPVDALKIDRSFVRSLLLPDRPAIVESILALARTLHTSVVAEGIETTLQARELERLGCTHAQGFLFSCPLSAASVEELLAANRPLGPKGLEPAVDATIPSGFVPADEAPGIAPRA